LRALVRKAPVIALLEDAGLCAIFDAQVTEALKDGCSHERTPVGPIRANTQTSQRSRLWAAPSMTLHMPQLPNGPNPARHRSEI
jgi:hypothetical protein